MVRAEQSSPATHARIPRGALVAVFVTVAGLFAGACQGPEEYFRDGGVLSSTGTGNTIGSAGTTGAAGNTAGTGGGPLGAVSGSR